MYERNRKERELAGKESKTREDNYSGWLGVNSGLSAAAEDL